MSENENEGGEGGTPTVIEETVHCGKCDKDVQPKVKDLILGKAGFTMLCPSCGEWTVLKKEDSQKVANWLDEQGLYEEKVREREEKRGEEEPDDAQIVMQVIDGQLADHKIKEDDRKNILDFFEMNSTNIVNWFDPTVIYWVMYNLEQLLQTMNVQGGTINKICGKVRMRMQNLMMKRQRENALANMYDFRGMPVSPGEQYGQPGGPMAPPAGGAAPPTGAGAPAGGAGPGLPWITPYGVVHQQPGQGQGGQGQQGGYGPQPGPGQGQDYSQQQQQVREKKTEDETEVEEVLDEQGNVTKRIVRGPGGKEQESEMEKMMRLGFLRSPGDVAQETVSAIVKELSAKGVLGGKEEKKSHVSEMMDTYGSKREQDLENKLEEYKKEFDKLREEMRQKEIDKMQSKIDEMEDKHSEEVRRLEDKIEEEKEKAKQEEATRTSGKEPEGVQEMKVRKDTLGKVSDDARQSFQDVLYAVVNPFADLMKTQNIQQLMAWEEAGRLPPGTVQSMMSTKKPTKGDVDQAKEKVEKLKKSS